MFGKGVFQAEENLLREIIRSVDKRIDYSAKEGDGTKFSIHVKLRNHEGEIILDLEDLQAAKTRADGAAEQLRPWWAAPIGLSLHAAINAQNRSTLS
ncbi:MAG: hypothetical protein ACREPG_10615 [Candidatus Binatia bacterium]